MNLLTKLFLETVEKVDGKEGLAVAGYQKRIADFVKAPAKNASRASNIPAGFNEDGEYTGI